MSNREQELLRALRDAVAMLQWTQQERDVMAGLRRVIQSA